MLKNVMQTTSIKLNVPHTDIISLHALIMQDVSKLYHLSYYILHRNKTEFGLGSSQHGRRGRPVNHDDVIKWKHFPRYWPFVREIHQSLVNFPHKGQWHGALMFSLICAGMNGWVNNCNAGDLRRHRAHYDVIVMCFAICLDMLSIV